MKIITQGNPPFKIWWLGKTAKCKECGTVVELEDKFLDAPQRNPHLPTDWEVDCPVCEGKALVNDKDA